MDNVITFFHTIAPAIIKQVKAGMEDVAIVEQKGHATDYSTKVDVDTENYIVAQLGQQFPGDKILAEEGYADTAIPQGRIWLIDPICGTNNLGKGLVNFCTNLALLDNGTVVAACVVDHALGQYIWSVGDGVYVNDQPYKAPSPDMGQKVDVDFGSLKSVSNEVRQKHNAFLGKLVQETQFDIVSLNTSLGFAYTATGKTDGFVNVHNHPWDIAAAGFLIQQVGGVITGLGGEPWKPTTVGAIAGRTPEMHQRLLELFRQA